ESVAGELPWVAQVGDKGSYMDAVSAPYILSAEWTETELEWSRGEWIDPEELQAAFGLKSQPVKPHGIAPHQPFPHAERRAQIAKVALFIGALNLLFVLWALTVGSGRKVTEFSLSSTDYAEEFLSEPFTVSEANSLCSIKAEANADNSWLWLDLALVDEQDQVLIETSAECSYYHGVEGGESWSEGSRSDRQVFKVEEPGRYRFLLKGEAGRGELPGDSGPPVRITIREGLILSRWSFAVLGVCGFLLAIYGYQKLKHHGAVWSDE
ncbi:MAG: DUF4178 domain-containing protein, partial [Planctomycetes bacterium]|nr:DUF4178 domain-containing protein [Planctomycetota bacterium]